uniref:Tetraspanin n=1 Tax=Pygocentrus nattereri TaxID=42514 RepID=A0A3B4EAA5_PYGNA
LTTMSVQHFLGSSTMNMNNYRPEQTFIKMYLHRLLKFCSLSRTFRLWLYELVLCFAVMVMGSFTSQLLTSSYICMGVGGALCLLGMIGCSGAWTQNRWLILLYFFIVSMMFIGQIVGTIVVILYKDVVTSMIREASKESLMTAYMGPAATDPISRAWNSIMIEYKCCGFENSTDDFKSSIFGINTGLLYPKTCCVDMNSPECNGLDTTPSLIHHISFQIFIFYKLHSGCLF